MAINMPSLWTTIRYPDLPPQILSEFVLRARSLRLNLGVDVDLEDEKMPVDTWLCDPILRRCERIRLSSEDKGSLVDALALIKLSLPLHTLRDLSIHYDLATDD